MILKDFLPFLEANKVQTFGQLDVPLLNDFQDALLAKDMKAVTVNSQLTAVGKVIKYLTRKGIIKTNPYLSLEPVPAREGEKKTHGCFELNKIKGVFEKKWQDNTSRLLNMIIYTMDMRNSEITRMTKGDISVMDGCHFLQVRASKTASGIRLITLHDTVFKEIKEYAKDMGETEPMFGGFKSDRFMRASSDLGKMLGASEDYLKENFITFYSGRHFWKTMMSAGGLGEDAEEFFMGHKVSGNVAKLYNHRDKRGKDLLVKKAKEVYAILDQYIFNGSIS